MTNLRLTRLVLFLILVFGSVGLSGAASTELSTENHSCCTQPEPVVVFDTMACCREAAMLGAEVYRTHKKACGCMNSGDETPPINSGDPIFLLELTVVSPNPARHFNEFWFVQEKTPFIPADRGPPGQLGFETFGERAPPFFLTN